MQVRLTSDQSGPNPDFNPRKPRDRQTNWPEVPKPAGTVVEGPNAWMLCVGPEPIAEPVDDEAKAKVAEVLKWKAQKLQERAERDQTRVLSGETIEDEEDPKPARRTRKREADPTEE